MMRTATGRLVAGNSIVVEFSVPCMGEPVRAMWPSNEGMEGATYLIEVDGLSAVTKVTPFPDYTCTS